MRRPSGPSGRTENQDGGNAEAGEGETGVELGPAGVRGEEAALLQPAVVHRLQPQQRFPERQDVTRHAMLHSRLRRRRPRILALIASNS